MSKFSKSLKIGTKAETVVINLLSTFNIKAKINDEKEKLIEYDVVSDIGTIEIKYDLYEAKSGNLAVEFWNTKKNSPSGILATTSKWWCFVLSDMSIWICYTDALRKIFEQEVQARIIYCGGDQNAAMKLYRRSFLFPLIFERIDKMCLEQFNECLDRLQNNFHKE